MFTFSFPVTLTFELDLKFAPLVTLVQRYVPIKLEIYMAFLFRETPRHGADEQTDGVQHLMLSSYNHS